MTPSFTCMVLLITLISGNQCVDGCDYFYNQVPNDTCNIMKGGSANFNCDIRGTCNTFSVLWFKNTNMHITNGYEQISQSDGPSGKYKVLTSGPRAAANDHCNFGTTLIINRFNHSDNGYYWCQIVSNNSCPLRPSPHGYVAVGETMNEPSCTFERQLPRPICAEDATFQMTEGMGCISESISLNSTIKLMPTVINPYSIHIYNINSTTLMATSMVNSHDTSFDREENMVWVYGLVTVCLLVIIVLVLSLVIVSVKCRTQQKQTSGSHYNEVRLEQEISNPHYIKTFYADNNVEINKEASLTLNNTQCKTGQNEGQPQSADCSAVTADEANNEGMHTPANYNKEKAIDYCNHSPEYAAVNKAKYGLKIKNSVQVTADDEWFSPSYDEVGGHEAASKTVVIIKEQENPSACIEPQKRSPSPVYAEVHKDKKKKKQQEDHSVVVEEGERSQSPEYSKVENIKKHSKNIIENQEDEQHYYHSLEKPEEHGCTGNNIGETVYISEDSQKSQIVSTQSMLCETPDPDANTHTQTTDSEVKIFPNPCYHTKMLAAD